MATTARKGKPFVWVTWASKLLAGDAHCRWAAWYRAHYQYDKRPDPDASRLAAWTADHDRLVRSVQARLEQDHWSVTIEDQNRFYLHGTQGILSGKPDLIAKQKGQKLRIVDGKTGEPRKSDWWQGLIYLIALPLAWKADLWLQAELVYRDHNVFIEPEEATPAIRADLFALLREVTGSAEVKRTPSVSECGRCDVLACPDRMTADEPTTTHTEEF